ncbi:alpha/beta fold hydrolase [Geomonas sp. RF6]|uniref:alpha/beta fold hydrolase n=1 Tax=Geomonas sp. RF6 TaxID=2897342 RepID=UPI001E33A9D7|nr:alpha/beta fold hydrolase [Geomonas sp. RF6]UFS71131.1 alpha/beta fold hydrolase [Geomonas sp. RF6]
MQTRSGGFFFAVQSFLEVNRMRIPTLLLAALLLSPLPCRGEETYGYPIAGAYEATLLGTPTELRSQLPPKVRTRTLLLQLNSEEKPPVFFYDNGLRCTFAYQKKKAPLVFVIGPTGASDQSSTAMSLLKALYHAGCHVITIPSTTHPNFIISGSQSHVPGDLATDASDLYRVMESAWKEVEGDVEASAFYLIGTSLGGVQAPFVARLDEERRIFNFRKVLMINPPVSLYNAVVRIDSLLNGVPEGPGREGAFFNRMLDKFTDFYSYGNFVAINDDFLYAVYQERLFSREEAGGLIAISFRINSAGMIFTSDVMTNSGYVVPKNRVLSSNDALSDYFLVCTHLSFLQYFNEYLYPHLRKTRPELSKEEFIASLSLKTLDRYLRGNRKFGIMTNANDFLLAPDELLYLQELFGERAIVYPRGGHLGNVQYRENMARVVDFFTKD